MNDIMIFRGKDLEDFTTELDIQFPIRSAYSTTTADTWYPVDTTKIAVKYASIKLVLPVHGMKLAIEA